MDLNQIKYHIANLALWESYGIEINIGTTPFNLAIHDTLKGQMLFEYARYYQTDYAAIGKMVDDLLISYFFDNAEIVEK